LLTHIEAHLLDRPVGELINKVPVCDVPWHNKRPPPEGSDLLGNRFDFVLSACGEHNVAARFGKGDRDAFTDPPPRTGHYGNAVGELKPVEHGHANTSVLVE
jgi:hypothetical protein